MGPGGHQGHGGRAGQHREKGIERGAEEQQPEVRRRERIAPGGLCVRVSRCCMLVPRRKMARKKDGGQKSDKEGRKEKRCLRESRESRNERAGAL
jgi:hypothetical protein